MKKAITLTGSTLAMMCICIFANAQEDTTHVNIITPNEHNNEIWINDDTKADTTQVEDFTIEEQNITLNVGESLQLHVNPSSANVRWVQGAWDLSANPILVVDQNGLITALKAGESYVAVESIVDGNVRKQAPVTVLNQGSVKTGNKQFEPTKECQWEEVEFTLTNNGNFIAQGVFYGSGAKSNQLNYLVTDQCIFMWFDIDYADSTKNFYPQPFTLEISDCNALAYNIYFNNSTQVVENSRSFANYAIKRGASTGGTTQTAYYYYQGEKINLTLNENKICLFVPKDSVGISQRVLATLEPLDVINDDEYVIYVINDEDYQELSITDPWDDDSRSVITTQCYFTEKGTEVYSSPYIILGLKKEQDSSILESYSEQYGFKIVRNEPLMPLYYILSITPICKMNTLECANKLYETGLFASSEPDYLMSAINKGNGGTPTLVDETATQPVQVLETKYYNITGQTTDSPSGLILVVTRYSDGMVSTEKKLFR